MAKVQINSTKDQNSSILSDFGSRRAMTAMPTNSRQFLTQSRSYHLNQSQDEQNQQEQQQINNQSSVRNIVGFVEKYDRVEAQELLCQMSSHWLLSLEDVKLPMEHPSGLMSQMAPLNDDHIILMVPYNESNDSDIELDYREIHQIIRELTIGIYVLNQHPYLQLNANYDESTSCQMPPAYIDTKIGQLMINTDYWLKALWHGAFFTREKRIKFSERWRQLLDIDISNGQPQIPHSVFLEFVNSGLNDISKEPEYGPCLKTDENVTSFSSSLYADQLNISRQGIPSIYVDLFQNTQMTDNQIHKEITHFHDYINDLAMVLTFGLNSVKTYRNLYEIDGNYEINLCCRADGQRISNSTYDRLKPIISMHEKFLRDNFAAKHEIRRNIKLMNIISFLVPLLMGLKRRMKIPNLNNLLPMISGEDVHTEKELPPLMIGNDFRSHLFSKSTADNNNLSSDNLTINNKQKYFNLHGGIQIEIETCPLNFDCEKEFEKDYDTIKTSSSKIINAYVESEQQLQEYKVPLIQVNNKKYWVLKIDFENYYAQTPQKPHWVSKLTDDLVKLKPKRLPMNEYQIYDLFKRLVGYKKATKYKNPILGLRASAQRGLLGIFQRFLRKTPPSQLAKHDDIGLGLMHYAAIFNHPSIITTLILTQIDSNIKQQIDYIAVGPMPVHYASRCGSLDALSCLLCNYANVSYADHEGWAAIHHAAYFDNVPALKLLIRRQPELIELTTRSSEGRRTPLLVAASAGSLMALKVLIKMGANRLFHDELGYNVVHVAVLKNHINIIQYLIETSSLELPTWSLLIEMLKSGRARDSVASVCCLKRMTNTSQMNWRSILDAGGVECLCEILKKYVTKLVSDEKANEKNVLEKNSVEQKEIDNFTLDTISVLCNLADQREVKQKLSDTNGFLEMLTKIICLSPNEDIQSRVSILIADVASIHHRNKSILAAHGCLSRLLELLNKNSEDLLINSVNAIEILCINEEANQNFCANNGVFQSFMDLLQLDSDLLKSSISAAISAITRNNKENQQLALDQGLIVVVAELLKSKNMTVQVKASLALESLSLNNQITQDSLLGLDAATYMIRLLERMYYAGATIKSNMEDWSILVREQAAFTLWALAGVKKSQRKMIAEKIGIQQILSLVMSKSEKLQFVGAKCVQSLALENSYYQKMILKENGAELLIRLLKKENLSNEVILATVQAIAALCIDIAHVNNEQAQTELSERGAIKLLIDIMDLKYIEMATRPPFDQITRCIVIETAYALGCLILNREKDEMVERRLNLRFIVDLIETENLDNRLQAGLAISVFAYNNNDKQYEIKRAGGISYDYYRPFFEDPNIDPIHLCKACFQIVVLARVIIDQDQVWLTAMGISKIVHLLFSVDDQVVIQSAGFISSLAHTRAGVSDAIVTCNAVSILCDRLFHPSIEVRYSCAIALGYLTFNRTASRLLLHNCRNEPNIFSTLMDQLKYKDSKSIECGNYRRCVISRQFVESFQTAYSLGLPKVLVRNRVKFFEAPTQTYRSKTDLTSPVNTHRKAQTTEGRVRTARYTLRSQSAPLNVMMNRKGSKNMELVETSAIGSGKPKIDSRPYTQLVKRN